MGELRLWRSERWFMALSRSGRKGATNAAPCIFAAVAAGNKFENDYNPNSDRIASW